MRVLARNVAIQDLSSIRRYEQLRNTYSSPRIHYLEFSGGSDCADDVVSFFKPETELRELYMFLAIPDQRFFTWYRPAGNTLVYLHLRRRGSLSIPGMFSFLEFFERLNALKHLLWGILHLRFSAVGKRDDGSHLLPSLESVILEEADVSFWNSLAACGFVGSPLPDICADL